MQIIIHKNGKQLGPFPESQVLAMLGTGEVARTDLAWCEGMETWKPLGSFEPFKAAGPPPIPGTLSPQGKTEPLAIWSLILGVLSIPGTVLCLVGGLFAGIPAVICGHIGMSRIKRDPSLEGKGMALAGLITGYAGLVIAPLILIAVALPAIISATQKGKATQMLSNMRQIHLALQQAQLDSKTIGDPQLGFPADAKYTSAEQVKNMLVKNSYLSAADVEKLQFDKISIGNVSAEDPPDTILLQAKSDNSRSAIIFLKGGDGRIGRPAQSFGQPPPRTPAFLE